MRNMVKEMRERAGLSQAELAKRLGVTQQSIYYYESGNRDIKASVLIDMAKALDCTVSELLGLGRAKIVHTSPTPPTRFPSSAASPQALLARRWSSRAWSTTPRRASTSCTASRSG